MVKIDAVPAALKTAADAIRSYPRAIHKPATRSEFIGQFMDVNAAATNAVRDALAAVAPEVGWLDLEGQAGQPSDALPEGTWWVCDPIDGAVQLLQGINLWCISLALVVDGVVTAAWVYDPNNDEMFSASRGEGAFVNGRVMRASSKADLADAFVATSHAPDQNTDADANLLAGAAYTAVLNVAGAVRNLGPTSLQLAWVADGRIDAFWAFGADESNWVAGSLLAAESGAPVTDVHGEAITRHSTSILTAGPALRQALRLTLLVPESENLIGGRTPREFVLAMAADCFPPNNISAAEATERWTQEEGYRQVTNGTEVSREEQVQHLAYLQANVTGMQFDILHTIFDGKTLAVLQQVDAVTQDGGAIKSEVAAFFTINNGRIVETNEVTRAIEAHSGSQVIHTAR